MWSARKDDLQECVRVLNLVSAKKGVSSSDFFKVERLNAQSALRLTTAASAVAEVELSGTGNWPYKSPFYLNRQTFSPFITIADGVKDKRPYIFTDEGELLVKHGPRAEVRLTPQAEVVGYPPNLESFPKNKLMLGKRAIELMNCASTCAASELQSPHLACVYLKPIKKDVVRLLATNLKVIFSAKCKVETMITEPLPFPLAMIPVLGAAGLKSLLWEQKYVVAKFDRGLVWQTVNEQARTEFPADLIENTLAAGRQEQLGLFDISVYKFAQLTERLAYYLQGVKTDDWILRIVGTKGSDVLLVAAKLPDTQFKEAVSCESKVKKDFQFDLPLYMVTPVMQFFGKAEEKILLSVSLSKDGMVSYLRCKNIELAIPAKVM